MSSVSFCIEVVLEPEILEAGQGLDVDSLTHLQAGLDGVLDGAPWFVLNSARYAHIQQKARQGALA